MSNKDLSQAKISPNLKETYDDKNTPWVKAYFVFILYFLENDWNLLSFNKNDLNDLAYSFSSTAACMILTINDMKPPRCSRFSTDTEHPRYHGN